MPGRGAAVRGRRGFTLFEVVLVLLIFSLATALVAPAVTSGFTEIRLKATARKAVSALHHARNQAMRHRHSYFVEASAHGLKIRSVKSDEPVKEVDLPQGVGISAADNAVIAFYPGGGSSGGSFELSADGKKPWYVIRVEPFTGGVKVESSDHM